jgi:integrase
MRGDGRIYKTGDSHFWWIEYWLNGKQYRESSHSTDPQVAKRLLKRRRDELGADRQGSRPFVGPAQTRVTFESLKAAYLQDYAVRGLRSAETAGARAKHLTAYFGADRAVDITPTRLRTYQAARLGEQAEAATINREMAALHRMFRLAVKAGVLSTCPIFPARLEENPPRQGFFEPDEYLAIREHLPPHYQDVLDFAYYTGWRKQEIFGLEWREVDLPGGVIRLSPERSKTKAGRLLPLSPPLRQVLDRRWQARLIERRGEVRVIDLVFHKGGQHLRDWRKTWYRACKVVGLWQEWKDAEGRVHGEPTKRLHDCRRTAARNLVRAGVPERVAMALIGHTTRAMFDRYNIVAEADLEQAVTRLADYVAAQASRPVVVPLPNVAEGIAR